ncbi:hypothetical protein RUM43_015085 [Polyplax serrata]|uniref:Uncharacterized protein n=1 Tax=Polyplax serrata TaxID=468196 RepID=A0AAN8NHT1_POLSC
MSDTSRLSEVDHRISGVPNDQDQDNVVQPMSLQPRKSEMGCSMGLLGLVPPAWPGTIRAPTIPDSIRIPPPQVFTSQSLGHLARCSECVLLSRLATPIAIDPRPPPLPSSYPPLYA